MEKMDIQIGNEKLWQEAQFLTTQRAEFIEMHYNRLDSKVLDNELSKTMVDAFISIVMIPTKENMLEKYKMKLQYNEKIITSFEQLAEAITAAIAGRVGSVEKAGELTEKHLSGLIKYMHKTFTDIEIMKSTNWYLAYPIKDEYKKLTPTHMLMGSVPPPMIVPPKKWTEDESGGLYTYEHKMILTKGFRNVNKPIQRKLLNYLSEQEYKVNPRWSRVLKSAYEEQAKEIFEEGENIKAKLKNLDLKMMEARKRIEFVNQTGGNWYQFWQFDSRGRIYPRSYVLTTMGAEWEKALCLPTHSNYTPLKLNDKMTIQEWFNPKDTVHKWIAVQIANTFGLDKETFQYRVKWVMKNIENLLEYIPLADEPNLYENAVNALYDHYKGIVSPIMVHLDATNQALQLHSVLMKDEQGALHCNVKPRADGKQGDAYMALANELNKMHNTDIFTRKNCKFAVMTAFYNKMNPADKIEEKINGNILELLYKNNVKEDSRDEWENSVRQALQKLFPSAMTAMNNIQEAHSIRPQSRYMWNLPNGFESSCISMLPDSTIVNIEVKSPMENKINIELAYSKRWEKASEFYRGLAANLIHSVDGLILNFVANRMRQIGAPFEPIHDDYGTTPPYVDYMRESYTLAMLWLYESNLLENLSSQIFGYTVPFNKGNLTKEDIKSAKYMLS